MTFAFKKITLAVALGASALAVAAPADAQRYGGYRGRDDGGTAVIAGVAGLAIGAALASSANRRDDSYYYDEGYDGRAVGYPAYDAYYQGGYRGGGYRNYDGYSGYNGYRDDRRSGWDGRRGHDDRRNWHDDRGYRGDYRR